MSVTNNTDQKNTTSRPGRQAQGRPTRLPSDTSSRTFIDPRSPYIQNTRINRMPTSPGNNKNDNFIVTNGERYTFPMNRPFDINNNPNGGVNIISDARVNQFINNTSTSNQTTIPGPAVPTPPSGSDQYNPRPTRTATPRSDMQFDMKDFMKNFAWAEAAGIDLNVNISRTNDGEANMRILTPSQLGLPPHFFGGLGEGAVHIRGGTFTTINNGRMVTTVVENGVARVISDENRRN